MWRASALPGMGVYKAHGPTSNMTISPSSPCLCECRSTRTNCDTCWSRLLNARLLMTMKCTCFCQWPQIGRHPRVLSRPTRFLQPATPDPFRRVIDVTQLLFFAPHAGTSCRSFGDMFFEFPLVIFKVVSQKAWRIWRQWQSQKY